MPPRKRQRLSPPEESATSAAATPRELPSKRKGSGAPSPEDLVNDPWTDDQNTALMKGLIRWKPVGMHKHFRMLSLANYLHAHGHEAEHTRIPGIWAKLNTLYNMKTLDEREDNYGDNLLRGGSEDRSTPSSNGSGGSEDGSDSGSTAGEGKGNTPYFSFQLPEELDYRTRMFDRRLADEAPSSPPSLKHQLGTSETEPALAESFSMLDTEDYREQTSRGSTPASPPAQRGRAGRGGRGGKADAGTKRGVKVKEEAPPTRGGSRGTRGRPKKEVEESPEEEKEEEEEDEDEEEEEEDNDEEREDEDGQQESGESGEENDEEREDESEPEAPKTRGAATRGKPRGRGGRGRGRRGR